MLLSDENAAPNRRAAHVVHLLLLKFPFLFFPFIPSFSPPLSPKRCSAAAESLLSLQASVAPVKVFEWMLGFHCTQLFLHALGCKKTDRKFCLHQRPPSHTNEVLWGRKAAKRSVYLFLNNGNVRESHPGYLLILFYLMRKVKDRIPFTR